MSTPSLAEPEPVADHPASSDPGGHGWLRVLLRLLLGMVAGNASGALLVALAKTASDIFSTSPLATMIGPSLTLVPLVVGVVAMWVWRKLDLGIAAVALHALFCTALGIAGAYLFLHEGVICLIIVSPLLYGGVLAGAMLGHVWFARTDGWLRVSVMPVLALVAMAESLQPAPHAGVVTDTVLIQAPPSQVWPHVLSFPTIPEHPGYWLFQLGLPYPVLTTSSGEEVGAARECRFSGDAVFGETVARLERHRFLTFDIVSIPPDPELVGHLDPNRGEFELRDNGDGSTTLVGRTWYTLHVRPTWYFDGWTHAIFRQVHLRVMRHVKTLAEAEGS